MNNIPPLSKYEGRSLEDLRSSLRAINRRLDSLRMDAAILTGVLPLKPGRKFWVADEIDWTSPELSSLKTTYFDLLDKSYDLSREIEYREALLADNIPQYEATQKVYKFVNTRFSNLEEEAEFFRKNNLVRGRASLAEMLCKNPNFLSEVEL